MDIKMSERRAALYQRLIIWTIDHDWNLMKLRYEASYLFGIWGIHISLIGRVETAGQDDQCAID